MTGDRFRLVDRLFREAIRLPDGERSAYVRAQSADPSIVAEVEALLREDAATGIGLDEPVLGEEVRLANFVVGAAGDPEPIPETIGDYRIVGRIGRGGMGVVYEAEQELPRRLVALKVIETSLVSQQTQRRFEDEAAVLARLQHPGIAQIHEAGVVDTEGGRRAFIAMELVRGGTLTEHARQRELGVDDRLRLVAMVADAVHHAHQRGVIHRDLKPANILVDESGQPKVLDFGVARITDDERRSTLHRTSAGQIVGTLAYMSPEQAAGDPDELDVRSDVYALGVLAFELLTGRPPRDAAGAPLPELVRRVAEVPAPRLRTFAPRLRGDVETIVAAALRTDKEQRYPSAAALAEDIRRLLANQPINARAPTAIYQLRKFGRRHRGVVAASLLGLATLVGGMFATAIALRRALDAERSLSAQLAETDRQRRIAEAAAALLNDDVVAAIQPNKTVDDQMTLREVLDAAAGGVGERYEDPFAETSLRLTLAETYLGIGEIDRSEAQMRIAAERMPRLPEEDPLTLRLLAIEAEHADAAGRRADAVELYTELLDRLRRLDDPRPGQVGTTLSRRAEVRLLIGEAEAGLADALAARALCREAFGPAARETLDNEQVVGWILTDLDRVEEARVVLEDALAASVSRFGETDWSSINAMLNLAETTRWLGDLEACTRLNLRAERAMRERGTPERHPRYLAMLNNLALIYLQREAFLEAQPILERAVRIGGEVEGEDHPHTLTARHNLAAARMLGGDPDRAVRDLEQVIARRREVLGPEHVETLMSIGLQARALQRLDRLEEAEAKQRAVHAAMERQLGASHGLTQRARRDLESVIEARTGGADTEKHGG